MGQNTSKYCSRMLAIVLSRLVISFRLVVFFLKKITFSKTISGIAFLILDFRTQDEVQRPIVGG